MTKESKERRKRDIDLRKCLTAAAPQLQKLASMRHIEISKNTQTTLLSVVGITLITKTKPEAVALSFPFLVADFSQQRTRSLHNLRMHLPLTHQLRCPASSNLHSSIWPHHPVPTVCTYASLSLPSPTSLAARVQIALQVPPRCARTGRDGILAGASWHDGKRGAPSAHSMVARR